VLRFLKITIDALSPEGKSSFIIFWKSFDYPRIWQKLPNPIFHINSFMMSDCLRLGMMIPFIFNRFLKPQHFKRSKLTLFQQRTGISQSNLAVKLWLKCWVLVAKMMKMALFMHSFTEDDYTKLRECLDNEQRFLSRVLIFMYCHYLPN
jgi:hypothetical protein